MSSRLNGTLVTLFTISKMEKMTQKCKKSEKCRFFVLIRGG